MTFFTEERVQDLTMRSIKIVDIGFITMINFTLGVAIGAFIDNTLGDFDEKKQDEKHILQIFGELLLHLYILGIIAYIVRNLTELIPFPLDGYKGYDHNRLGEMKLGVAFTFALFFYQVHLREKLNYFLKRIRLMKQSNNTK